MYQMLKTEARAHRDVMPPQRLRREGWIPGVIYGRGMESVTFQVQKSEWTKFVQRAHSKIFEVEVPGNGKHLVSIDNVQKDPMGSHIMHLEFHHLEQNKATIVTLPFKVTGEAVGLKAGGVVTLDIHEIDVKGLPKDFVESIEVDITGLDINHSIHLSDLKLPRGLSFVDDGETVVAHCAIPRMKAELDNAVVEPEIVAEDETKVAS